jgi:hypothetical protein
MPSQLVVAVLEIALLVTVAVALAVLLGAGLL